MKQGTKKSDHPFSSLSFGQEISIPFVLIFFLYKMRAFHMKSPMIDPMIYVWLVFKVWLFFLSSSKVWPSDLPKDSMSFQREKGLDSYPWKQPTFGNATGYRQSLFSRATQSNYKNKKQKQNAKQSHSILRKFAVLYWVALIALLVQSGQAWNSNQAKWSFCGDGVEET